MTLLQVTQIRVSVAVLDVNDNEPKFSFTIKNYNVSEVSPVRTSAVLSMEKAEGHRVSGGQHWRDLYTEITAWLDQPPLHPQDTRVNTIVIPETELKATDADKDDILVYTLQEVTPVSAPPSPLITDAPSHPTSPFLMPSSLSSSTFQSPTSFPSTGCQQVLLPGEHNQPCSEVGPDPGFLQESEHDLQAAGTGKQITPS